MIRNTEFVKILIFVLVMGLITAIPVAGENGFTELLSDFEVYEADIRDVFRSIAEIGDLNVLLDPSVKGEVTIKLKHGLRIQEALEMLAQTYGYSYRWVKPSRTILIGNEKTFANFEAKETRVYQFNYANVEQVAEALKVVIPKDQIGIDKRTNQLTIKASVLEHQNIVEIASRLDQEMPQINIEARVEEISRTVSRELGVTWGGDALTSVDVDWSTLTFSKPLSRAALRALEEQNKARLLANPNISTTDSQEGKIFIGDKYPVVITDVEDDKKVYKIEYVEIGTVLTVTPRINEDDVVTVTVKATVSNIVDWIAAGQYNEYPVIRTREASSVIRLKDGETFALSGLNMNKSTDTKQSTPILSNIPLLGSLFTLNKSGPAEDSEIVIFLTPKIVRTKSVNKPESQITVEKKAETATKPAEPAVEKPAAPVQLNTGITEPKVEFVEKPAITAASPAQPTEQTVKAVEAPVEQSVNVENVPMVSELPVIEPVQSVLAEKNTTAFQVKYNVKTGDNLEKVAAKFGVNAEDICQANNIQAGTDLGSIKELMIPVPENRIYALKPKETLWRLAKRYGTTVEVLMELNNITDYTALEIGQQIILPVTVDQVADPRF